MYAVDGKYEPYCLLVYYLLATLINYFVTQYDYKNIGTFSITFIFLTWRPKDQLLLTLEAPF